MTVTGCFNSANNGTYTNAFGVRVTQNGNTISIVEVLQDGSSCTLNGTYSQLGRMGTVQGQYSCTSGEVGNGLVFEMNNTVSTITARVRFQSTNIGCTLQGEVAGVIPR